MVIAVTAAIGCSLRFDPGPKRTGGTSGGSTLTAPPPTSTAPTPGGTFEDRRCGGLGYADAPCDSCFRTHCCVDGITCGSNRECVALRDCWAMCETEECATQCESEHSTGSYDSEQLDGCMESYCASACE